jgi:DNA repair protein RadC
MCAMKLLPFTSASSPRIKLVTVEQCWTVCEASRVSGPYEARDLLVPYFQGKDREHFVVLHLDSAHQPLSVEVVSVGTLNLAVVHPREVFKGAILANAQGIIAAHNHPSGKLDPSEEDRQVFKRLKHAGDILGIKLLDFLVISGGQFRSLSDPHIGGE